MTAETSTGRVGLIGVALFIAILGVFAGYWLAVSTHQGPFTDVAAAGQFGDAFGALTSLFNALAFGGLFITILLQRHDLRLQHQELQLQRQELEQTRGVLDEQREQLASQAEAARRQVFEASFFRLLESLRQTVNASEYGAVSGIKAFHAWATSLRGHAGTVIGGADLTPPQVAKYFSDWYRSSRSYIGSYFELVRMILEFVEGSDREDKDRIFYTDVLRSTLTTGELLLLFHYGLSDTGDSRFKKLVEKYGFLDAFEPEMWELPATRRGWYSAHRIPRDYAASRC